jgi:phosphatidylethanolamine/phosphatidyl-N-methylethanolamine N-methyltransferase
MSLHRKIKESAQFSWASLTQPQKTGSIVPSSPMLAAKLASLVAETKIPHVIELGPGTGAITSRLLEIGPVKALEFNPEFVRYLEKTFPKTKLQVQQGDARHLDHYFSPDKPTVIASGIPLRALAKEDRKQILHSIHHFLQRSGGIYIQFTYDLFTRPQTLYPQFRPLSTHYVWANVPPARVHVLEGFTP